MLSRSFVVNYKWLNRLNIKKCMFGSVNLRYFSIGTLRMNTKHSEKINIPPNINVKLPRLNYLLSYLDVCTTNGKVKHAEDVLLHFTENLNMKFEQKTVDLFNIVLNAWASEGNYALVSSLLLKMESLSVHPNLQSFCSAIESIVRTDSDKNKIMEVLKKIEERQDLHLENIFAECSLSSDQQEKILQGIRQVNPLFHPKDVKEINVNKDNQLHPNDLCEYSSGKGITIDEMKRLAKLQLDRELNINIPVESVTENPLDSCSEWKSIWDSFESMLKNSLLKGFENSLETLRIESFEQNPSQLSLYPYLTAVKPETYVDVMLQEFKKIVSDKPLSTLKLQHNLGTNIMQLYFLHKRKKNEDLDKINALYSRFVEYNCNANISSKYTPRAYWLSLEKSSSFDSTTCHDKIWTPNVVQAIGTFLRDILLNHAFVDANLITQGNDIKEKKMQKALTISVRGKDAVMKCHGVVKKLYHFAHGKLLMMDSSLLPMLSPPMPWLSFNIGGYLTSSIPLICQTNNEAKRKLESYNLETFHLTFDALNSLSNCPWKINIPMLDLILQIYRDNDENERKKFRIKEKFSIENMKILDRKMNKDLFYALPVANEFRNDIIWFPHNVDFRGRAYPCTEYFKHYGTFVDDILSSLFLFADGQEIGERGIEWLKIHLVNLTGFKKRTSIKTRLTYWEEISGDVMDSADKPLTGRKWWMNSEKPWLTLACCMELSKCLRSPNPNKFISHLPIHQDGSCNVLQHFVALGRDDKCAKLVNLIPNEEPQDFYSKIAEMVEQERKETAEKNNKIAQAMEGVISRNIMKPFIIHFIYGGSLDGASQEVSRKLDNNEFPHEYKAEAIAFLLEKAALHLTESLHFVTQIHNWFHKTASIISEMYSEPVQWISPLGFPILQPHFLKIKDLNVENAEPNSLTTKFIPNVERQVKSFPPNFIHNLESSHMMLTALHCHRKGIPFASVHDCFWTTASNTDLMNKIIREEFINLHSQPLLKNLAKSFQEIYIKRNENLSSVDTEFLKQLNSLPSVGKLNLNNVLQSTYFFN